jgi:dienelactone hydrolase
LGTLLIDIETPEERALGSDLGRSPIDLEEMASRIRCATRWLRYQPDVTGLPIGYLGAGTGAGAVFMAAADHRDQVKAIVCRGGKLEPALSHLPRVETPSLLIVGARDVPLVQENHNAIDRLGTKDSRLEVIPGARHLFEEPGALTAVAMHSASWFARFLTGVPAKAAVQMGIWIA